jgi:hypothetical protein
MYNLQLLTYLAPSSVCDGVGVFSLVDIPQDTCIFKPKEKKHVFWCEVSSEIRNNIENLVYGDEHGFWVDCDLDRIGQQYYINHSNLPNVSYNKDTGELYSVRNIKKDEELTDYYFPGERDWLT